MAAKPLTESNAKPIPLRAGQNVLAVQVALSTNSTDVLMQARLDQVRRPVLPADVDEKIADEVTEKLVTQRAVVCDLCSTLPGQTPACVSGVHDGPASRVAAEGVDVRRCVGVRGSRS